MVEVTDGGGDKDQEGESEDEDEDGEGTRVPDKVLQTKRRKKRSFTTTAPTCSRSVKRNN